QGWEVQGIDRLGRFVCTRDPEHPQRREYRREVVTPTGRDALTHRLAPQRWEPCATRFCYAYYKRPHAALVGPEAQIGYPPTTAPPRCSAWPSARSARSWSSARSPPSPSSSTGDAGDAEPYRRAWRHGGQAAGSGVVSCSATGGGRPHPSDREHGRDRLLYLHDRSGCLVWQQRFRLIYSATVGRVLTVYPRNAICRAVACREMADGGVLFSGVFEILNRRHRVSDPDPDSGTFKLQDDDRTVRVVLEP